MTATGMRNTTHSHRDGLTDGEGEGGDGQLPGSIAPTVFHPHVGGGLGKLRIMIGLKESPRRDEGFILNH